MISSLPSAGMRWHIAELTDELRTKHTEAGSQSYEGASFQSHSMSLGPQQVIHAREVLVIASGHAKRPLVNNLLSMTAIDPDFLISVVHHPEITERTQVFLANGAYE